MFHMQERQLLLSSLLKTPVHNAVRHFSLRKHAYTNKLKFLPTKNENIRIKNYDIFHISAQNIDCSYSSEPPR